MCKIPVTYPPSTPEVQVVGKYREKKSSRTLLVVTTSDLEEVTLEFVTERVAGDLLNQKDVAISHSNSY